MGPYHGRNSAQLRCDSATSDHSETCLRQGSEDNQSDAAAGGLRKDARANTCNALEHTYVLVCALEFSGNFSGAHAHKDRLGPTRGVASFMKIVAARRFGCAT